MPTILVVDDQPTVRALLRDILVRDGFDVVEAADGRQALESLQRETVDLVLTDVLMPDMDGIELILRLRDSEVGVPIVAMSGGGGLSGMEVLTDAAKLGAVRVIEKPVHPEVLTATLRELLDEAAEAPPVPDDGPEIVVVDDDPAILRAVSVALEKARYPVRSYQEPEAALAAVKGGRPSLLITDVLMPGMSGFDLAREACATHPDLTVIIISGSGQASTGVRSLKMGAAGYLQKPFELPDLLALVDEAVRLRAPPSTERSRERAAGPEQARALQRVTVGALANFVSQLESKQPYLRGHSERVGRLSRNMASLVGLPPDATERVGVGGFLHDIGMVAAHDRTLDKPGPLADEEFEQVKSHVQVGADLLRPLPGLGETADMVLHHHERIDGSGYLHGLTGDDIPVGAQIIGVAESFAALVEERPYRGSNSSDDALKTLGSQAGTMYRRDLIRALELALRLPHVRGAFEGGTDRA